MKSDSRTDQIRLGINKDGFMDRPIYKLLGGELIFKIASNKS